MLKTFCSKTLLIDETQKQSIITNGKERQTGPGKQNKICRCLFIFKGEKKKSIYATQLSVCEKRRLDSGGD